MELDSTLRTYIAESRELLAEMEDILLRLERDDDMQASLNAVFRAAHTIKGSAGLFGLDDIVGFTHGVESLLDKLRAGTMSIDADMIAVLLACRDHINDLIDQLEQGGDGERDVLFLKGEDLTRRLQKYGAGTQATSGRAGSANLPQLQEASVERVNTDGQAASDNWHISLRFGPNSLRDGMDPISFLRYLGKLGAIVSINTLADAMPSVERMDPETCYLGFEINFSSSADKQSIENVFEFIRQDSLVRILPPHSQIGRAHV